MIKGAIENINKRSIRGWGFDTASPKIAADVTLYLDDELIEKKEANIFREELKQKIHPTGDCGFSFKIPPHIGYHGQKISVKINNQILNSHFRALLDEKSKNLLNSFQIFGERASGTNFLIQLLLKNLPNIKIVGRYGWKHFFPPAEFPNSDRCLFVVIYRDPFDWIRSLYLQPHHVHTSLEKLNFSGFIRAEWYCVFDELANVKPGDEQYGKEMMVERNPDNGKRFENVIKLRTAKILAFEAIRDKVDHIEFVRYEDIKNNPAGFIDRIARKHDIASAMNFTPVEKYKGITDEKYVPKNYFDISNQDYQYILKQLDFEVEKIIGYRIRSDVVAKNFSFRKICKNYIRNQVKNKLKFLK
jgi:hypothetical protein